MIYFSFYSYSNRYQNPHHRDEVADRFGNVLEFECRVGHLASGKLNASSAWHAGASQLIKLLPALNGDNMPTDISASCWDPR